ncbi:MAG: CheY-like chemotaxis protein [Candidatus Omnitrophota bacterium]|jgi:CheY-like chemotaxis protein
MEISRNPPSNGNTLYILLVDDSEAEGKIAKRAFEKAELKSHLSIVHSGEDALAHVSTANRTDLILLDIKMPKMDGFVVLEKIKAIEFARNIPIIIFTSSKNEVDIRKSYSLGAASYIQKPIDYPSFEKMIITFNDYWQNLNCLPKQTEQRD